MMLSQRSVFLLAVIWLLASATPEPGLINPASLNHIANISYAADNSNPSSLTAIFSPRMDFEQWKPLTGRGDPLRNDPTYDYEPPVLDRVHYWADDTRLEREHYPERKSEVLMLGVSSRKPSVAPRQPSLPPRRQHHRPPPPSLPPKYEDFAYKISEHYPMTILVPPPPPPPGHKPSIFTLSEEKPPNQIKVTNPPMLVMKETTARPEHLTSLYALQEANLIYQSSTTSQSWLDVNQTKIVASNAVSSDYAGWGPTTPTDDNEVANDTHNFISNGHFEVSKQPYSFYKPMLSEAPPPPQITPNPLLLPTFVPTAASPAVTPQPATISVTQPTWPSESLTSEFTTETQDYYEDTTTEKKTTQAFLPTPLPSSKPKPDTNIFDMLSPMMSMPLVNGPERPEDNLYAHASENLHVFQEKPNEDVAKLETMQTMQPPPVNIGIDSATTNRQPYHVNQHILNNMAHKRPATHTIAPFLHLRYTTPAPTIASGVETFESSRSTTEAPSVPMYLIIQGHSKVKTYSSKAKLSDDNHTISNEIPKPNEAPEIKHLHPLKEKHTKKVDKTDVNRKSRAQNLKSLIDKGVGSIEIQETDLGIKYDVSDGSEVPVEVYRKGIVDNDENDYSSSKKNPNENRSKRQIDLEDLIPFDGDTLEEYVYDYLKGRRNETGITGLIAQAVTSNAAAVVDDLDEDDDDNDDEER